MEKTYYIGFGRSPNDGELYCVIRKFNRPGSGLMWSHIVRRFGSKMNQNWAIFAISVDSYNKIRSEKRYNDFFKIYTLTNTFK